MADVSPNPAQLGELVSSGDRQALARLLTWIEADDPRAHAAEQDLPDSGRDSYVVGITGAPGGGKSTLVNALVSKLRERDARVGVVAVDPSSPYTGGALLGDRVRMADHLTDDAVFIRSLANRGQLGGLANAAPRAVRALQSAGFEWILIETVGVGQVEVDVALQADTTIVVLTPGWGDDIQASKSGIMEIGDIFVVNKSDRPGARETQRSVSGALRINRDTTAAWEPPVVLAIAESGDVADVLAAIDRHHSYAVETGELADRRARRRRAEWRSGVTRLVVQLVSERLDSDEMATLSARVTAGELSPSSGARIALQQILG